MISVERFISFVEKENLFRRSDRLLLAVSGGLDSIVLCELCHVAGYRFQIAHCNFLLRGEESERDERFVRSLAQKYGVEIQVRRFNTTEYAVREKVSIQVAARNLRYAWFNQLTGGSGKWPGLAGAELQRTPGTDLAGTLEIKVPGSKEQDLPAFKGVEIPGTLNTESQQSLENEGPGTTAAEPHFGKIADKLLTAHHGDDNLETVLMNFMKGTGMAGLRGILPLQGNIVRPLLFARKLELLQYAEAAKLKWVEDSSNSSVKYTRNRLRNETIPILETLYPAVAENIFNSIPRLREIDSLYRQRVEQYKRKLLVPVGREFHIPVQVLKKIPEAATLLYEIGKPFGFTAAQVSDISELPDAETGKYIQSSTHSIIRHRNMLILAERTVQNAGMFVIESPDADVEFSAGRLQFVITDRNKHADISDDSSIAWLDFDKIVFPLVLRKRRQGDYFYPLGMKKKKKVGRFLSDSKLSPAQKENCWVMEMDKKIIWVIGRRIDDRFKVTDKTTCLLRINFLSNDF